jgi:hypothetical protein
MYPIMLPLVRWRMRGAAKTLVNYYRWLPATSWSDVEKHGQNVVYSVSEKYDVFTKEKKVVGSWVVDYKNCTVRIVCDTPEEFHKTGATF